jgi:tRNA(Ile)-lysidine synthase
VVCAVSGGADSLALLVLAVEAGLDVTAVHVDHGGRAGSAAEADVVAGVAGRYGARFERCSVDVAPGQNLEARWRDARRAALPAGALTGHTADDLAETVLLNLLRGSGVDGLAGIRPGPTKPLLRLRRSETHALCASLGLSPVHDPTNDDPSFRRNRVRHEVLPLLDVVADRDVAALLARQAELLRDDADLLDALAAAVDPTDATALAAAPLPLARRAVRRWLPGPDGHPLDAASVDRVIAVARCQATACELPGNVRIQRTDMRLRVQRS